MAVTKSKPAGKNKIEAGPSNKMHKFGGVGEQKPGVSSVEAKGGGGKFAKGGPSGKMHKFKGVGTQKPGVSSVETGGGKKGSYAK